jgi:hypothetical protein
MPETGRGPTAPSAADGDGVRVIRKVPAGGGARPYLLAASLLLGAGLVYLLLLPEPQRGPSSSSQPAAGALAELPTPPASAPVSVARSQRRPAQPIHPNAPAAEDESSDADADDLASYFRPGDPEPTMAEVIEALNHAGIRSGIGAFNPPGTSPPLAGLAVPEDFDLPEGFVRHHQVTDEGEPLEPILMFSPDYEFYDAEGRLVAIPDNRIVPPELAPPGLPIREMVPPKP